MRKALSRIVLFVIASTAIWFAFVKAGVFLSSPASLPQKADLIVVLGGDAGARSLVGAELYAKGFAPVVLLTGLDDGEKEILPLYLHWRAQVLVARGVPQETILYDLQSANSWEEAVNTAHLMKDHNWEKVLVVSDPPHMRRLNEVWRKAFAGMGKEYMLIPAIPSWWDAEHWWQNEVSGKFVVNEFIKLGYYWLKY